MEKQTRKFLDRESEKNRQEYEYILEKRQWEKEAVAASTKSYRLHKSLMSTQISNLKTIKELTGSNFTDPEVKTFVEGCLEYFNLLDRRYRRRLETFPWTEIANDIKQAEELKYQHEILEDIKQFESQLDKLELSDNVTVSLNLHKQSPVAPLLMAPKFMKSNDRVNEVVKNLVDPEYYDFLMEISENY